MTWMRRLKGHVDRRKRSLYLLLWGAIDVVIATSLLTPEAMTPTGRAALGVADNIMSPHQWGLVWLFIGGLCLFSAVTSRLEVLSFVLASGIMAFWAAAYILTGILLHSLAIVLRAGLIYSALAAVIILEAGPPDIPE